MKNSRLLRGVFSCSLSLALLDSVFCVLAQNSENDDWPNYGNDPGGMRYSTLTQINRDTVAKLKVAWVFHTGDIADGSDGYKRSGFETTPILVDGTLYLTTPFNRVIALDPATGMQRWTYDPHIDRSLDYGDGLINRGVTTWLDSSRSLDQPCRRRIFEATLDARLVALDAATGQPCVDFGSQRRSKSPQCSGIREPRPRRASSGLVSHDLASGHDR